MQQKTIVVLASIAFATCIALILLTRGESEQEVSPLRKWRDCSTSSVKIKSVEVPQCNRTLMTERCALKDESDFNIKVNFVQGDFMINKPFYDIEFATGWSHGTGRSCAYGLECPGKPGTEQHLNYLTSLDAPRRTTNITIKLMVHFNYDGQKTGSEEQSDLLCVEIPTFIVYPNELNGSGL